MKKNKTDFKRFHFRVSGTIGTVPYIELNGEQFEDSNLIIEKLKLHFGVDPENGLRFVKNVNEFLYEGAIKSDLIKNKNLLIFLDLNFLVLFVIKFNKKLHSNDRKAE